MALEVGGKSIALDEEGYLENLSDWSPEVAEALATAEDVSLTTEAGWRYLAARYGSFTAIVLALLATYWKLKGWI